VIQLANGRASQVFTRQDRLFMSFTARAKLLRDSRSKTPGAVHTDLLVKEPKKSAPLTSKKRIRVEVLNHIVYCLRTFRASSEVVYLCSTITDSFEEIDINQTRNSMCEETL
jgi:hypothetical protein